MNQLTPLPLQQILHRDPCSLCHHPRNIVQCHPVMEHRQRRLLIPIRLAPFCRKLVLQRTAGMRPAQIGPVVLRPIGAWLPPVYAWCLGCWPAELFLHTWVSLEFVLILVHSPVCQTLVKQQPLSFSLSVPAWLCSSAPCWRCHFRFSSSPVWSGASLSPTLGIQLVRLALLCEMEALGAFIHQIDGFDA